MGGVYETAGGSYKKGIALLLVLAAILLLGACGAGGGMLSAEDPQTEVPPFPYAVTDAMSAEEKLAAVDEGCVGFFRVEINPVFELYVTWDENVQEMRVRDVRTVNTDAEALFRQLPLSGMTLWDALVAVCDAAREQGFLTAESTVRVEYTGQLHSVKEVVTNVLEEYQAERDVTFLYETAYTEILPPGMTGADEDEERFDVVERDAQGNLLRTVYTDPEETFTETCTYDAEGAVLSRITEYRNEGTTVEEHYAAGVPVSRTVDAPQDIRTETFDANGELVSDTMENKVTGDRTENFYTGGVLTRRYSAESGCERTETFDANGALTCEIINDTANGSYTEKHYSGGSLTKNVVSNASYEMTQLFDGGRMTAETIANRAEGSYSESRWTYYAGGAAASYTVTLTDSYYTQGYYSEEHYYESGAVSMRHVVSQYGDNKFYYDEAGNPTQYEGKNNLGERVEIVYAPDGSHVDRIYETGGAVRIETWGADGSLTVTYN